ncbi:unnamed protein product [Fraxinus pennsylvanica]|uniref:Protein kinase domain-containing protein n=1 Tax=Fraxinus pennsylvanica TaxID=56036 RepID=A0AAD1YUD7_9LAMI|nr:unnamed protein product [Fraxinus pennsylvanica]
MLESGSDVAVKGLEEMKGLGKKEFIQQTDLLGMIKHENLVEIISFNSSKDEKLIIYEHVPNGNLFSLLSGKTPEFAQGKKLTKKADLYYFGVVLLEIITGKVPAQVDASADDLSDWVQSAVNNDWSTDILDVEIVAEKKGYDGMLKLIEIALERT